MRPEEKISFLMLFCTLLVARNAKATLTEFLVVIPLAGKAERLAGELVAHGFWT